MSIKIEKGQCLFYAGIGSRETPDYIKAYMTHIARILNDFCILSSGGASGADTAFKNGSTFKRIYSPEKYNSYDNEKVAWTRLYTEKFHPNPSRLSLYGRKRMDRNAAIVLGRDGCTPVDFVICWTKDGKDSGGTGQACRIARYFDIPVFNLKTEHGNKKVFELLEAIKNG